MKNIVISLQSRQLRNGLRNAKDYPFANELIKLLHDVPLKTIQVGSNGERDIGCNEKRLGLKLCELKEIIISADFFVSIDNFLQHYATYLGKKGIVIFSKSDPLIYGYDNNINILKDRKYLRKDQFSVWEECPYDHDAFITPDIVVKSLFSIVNP